MFRKPSTSKLGPKILVMGETGAGKSLFGLSFPKVIALDSEAGLGFYEGKPEGKNIVGIKNTQDFTEIQDAIEEVTEMIEDDASSVSTFIIDSETKFFQNLTDVALQLEEKKARAKGKDVMDSSVSIRGFGRIKSVATRLQNLKIDLSSKGVTVISVTQIDDIKEKIGENFVKVGEKPVMSKGASYDYDIIIKLFYEEVGGKGVYKGEILKDRTNVTKRGDILENPSYNVWKKHIEKAQKLEIIEGSLAKDSKKSLETLTEQDATEEKSSLDELKSMMATASVGLKALAAKLIKDNKIKVADIKPDQLETLASIVREMKDFQEKEKEESA